MELKFSAIVPVIIIEELKQNKLPHEGTLLEEWSHISNIIINNKSKLTKLA